MNEYIENLSEIHFQHAIYLTQADLLDNLIQKIIHQMTTI